MNKRRLAEPSRLLSLLLVLCVEACTTADQTGQANVDVSISALSAADVTGVDITITGPGMTPMHETLVEANGVYRGVIGGIPVGDDRVFLAEAHDLSGTVLFHGSSSPVTINATGNPLIAIVLSDTTPVPFHNSAPHVDSIYVSSQSITPGTTITLAATASDPDGDALTAAWTGAGTFGGPASLATQWTAPSTEGTYPLTITVTDPQGASDSLQVLVDVRSSNTTGAVEVTVTINSSPRVLDLTTPNGRAVPLATAAATVDAVDPDGDPLTYAWSSDCGAVFGPATASTTFVVPATAVPTCLLRVDVSDGRGGTSYGDLRIAVGPDPIPTNAPVIDSTFQSATIADDGEDVILRVAAHDPDGGSVVFGGSADRGAVVAFTSTATGAELVWHAPACFTHAALLTVWATDAMGETTTVTFTIDSASTICASFTPAMSMTYTRYLATATALPSGQVLVVGGTSGGGPGGIGARPNAETYNPAAGNWTAAGVTTSPTPRYLHTATLLPSGKVLVVGGGNDNGILSSADLYDLASGEWSGTDAMFTPRYGQTATLLPSGDVLVAGGTTSAGDSTSKTVELYSPNATPNKWSHGGALFTGRYQHTASLLMNGKVLFAGGGLTPGTANSAELYDPVSQTSSWTPPMNATRVNATATLLPSGKVLVAGGSNGATVLQSAELYDPATGMWVPVASMNHARTVHTATLLSSGLVLVVGGQSMSGWEPMSEVYDPTINTWTDTAVLLTPRSAFTATSLPSGDVLIVGGWNGGPSDLNTAELYQP